MEWIETKKGPWPLGVIDPEVLQQWYMEEPLDAIHQCITQSIMVLISTARQQDQDIQLMKDELLQVWQDTGTIYDRLLYEKLTSEQNLEELISEKEQLEDQLKQIQAEIEKQESRTMLTCEKCESQWVVQHLVWIQTHWYTPPRSCNEGDYWNEGEGQWKCPDCNHLHRSAPQRLRRYFKSEEKIYDR